jgi:flagellar basal-body rod modification protein FlgD
MAISSSPVSTPVTDPYANLSTGSTATSSKTNSSTTAEGFLKLLVTQLQNQDPLNPMDNAQLTSQMAQINTVNGITTLNTTVKQLSGQFTQLQALQGAALVGHDVTVQGNRMEVGGGVGAGAFELANAADAVKVEVLDGSGRVVDTLQMGAETGGTHQFNWQAPDVADGTPFTFRVIATSGTNAVVTTPLMRDRVLGVSSSSTGLVLQTLHSGDVAYAEVKAFN